LREDIPVKPGFSKELICKMNLGDPGAFPTIEYLGGDTLWYLYQKTVDKIPNHNHLGSRNTKVEGAPYEWKTFIQVY